MRPFYEKMSNMKYMIPYLGFEMYPKLLQMTRRYHQASSQSKKVVQADEGWGDQDGENGQADLMMLDMGGDGNADGQAAGAGGTTPGDDDDAKQGVQQRNLQSLKHLDDPIANELFISIIKLMEYFCLESESTLNDLFDEISQSLDQNKREDALFNCLAIPDDHVRLAVVRCLYVVPLDEFDADEIEKITSIMTTCNNICAGETELILSTIYWICTKFVTPDSDDGAPSFFL